MGIVGFNKYLKKLGLVEKTITFEEMKGSSIVIDVMIWLYPANAGKTESYKHPYFLYFLKMIEKFIKYDIRFMFVFDGISINLKSITHVKRAKVAKSNQDKIDKLMVEKEAILKKYTEGVITDLEDMEKVDEIDSNITKRKRNSNTRPTREDIKLLKEMFDHFHIPYVTIDKHEAEGLCAYLNKIGYVDYVLSNDSDIIISCGKNIIYGFKCGNDSLKIRYFSDIIRLLKFSHQNQLINFAYLCGTDYNNHIYRRRIAVDHKDILNCPNYGFNVIMKRYPEKKDREYFYIVFNEFIFDYSTIYGDKFVKKFGFLKSKSMSNIKTHISNIINHDITIKYMNYSKGIKTILLNLSQEKKVDF